MVLQNIVILEDGVPARLHFADHSIEKRTITAPVSGRPGVRNVLVFEVDTLNGAPVVARFSTMAEKLAGLFEPYLREKTYTKFDFIITQLGEGFMRRWSVQAVPK